MDKIILVYYISTVGIQPDEIEDYFNKLIEKISAQSVSEDSEIIFIPILGESRIECINPKYITDGDLIKKHERLISELHENLQNQIDLMEKKIETNESK